MRLIVLSLVAVAALAACTEQAPPSAPAGETPAPAPAEPRPTPPATDEPATPAPQPGHIALAEMARAIDTLPLEQKEALLLVTLEGLAYKEAADILNIPLGTLMSRLGRARAALRTLTGSPAEPHLRTVK